jgi:hypothetical protein
MTLTGGSICPICGKDDQVQSIRAVVSSGSLTGTGETGRVQVMFTYLAARLRPPADPRPPKRDWGRGCAIAVLWYVAVPTIGAVVTQQSDTRIEAIVLLVALAAGILILTTRARSARKTQAERYRRELEERERKTRIWRQLSYCFRDDAVFVYANGDCVYAPASSYESIYSRLVLSDGGAAGAEYRIVRCDICNTNYTDSLVSGGYLSGSWAICPNCVEKNPPGKDDILCPPGISFADFVRSFD